MFIFATWKHFLFSQMKIVSCEMDWSIPGPRGGGERAHAGEGERMQSGG